jgi:hypothetical protein
MRFDKLDTAPALTGRQLLFVETWFNEVHEFSVDAFRVRVMNPVNILEETLKSISEGQFSAEDKARIWAELVSIFEDSFLLDLPPYRAANRELLSLIKEGVAKPKEADKHSNLIDAYGRELLQALKAQFVTSCTGWLSNTLAAIHPGPDEDPELENVQKITGQLLSCLVADGWSIESLFQMYRTVLRQDGPHTKTGEAYQLMHALAWMFDRLASHHKQYCVTFSVNQLSNADAIPRTVGDIEFKSQLAPVSADASRPVKKFVEPARNKLFASMTLAANDSRIAGMRAAAHIEQVLDVVRYDFLKQNFALSDSFLVEKEEGRHILLPILKTVPNPPREITTGQLHDFMNRLATLVSSGTLREDFKDRIYSAFRLYRTGAETSNLENKLVNWWTALEYLIKAGGNGGIGTAVENALYPTVTMSYVLKHMDAAKAAMKHFGLVVKNAHGVDIEYTAYQPCEMYTFFIDKNTQGAVTTAVASSPYAALYFKRLFAKFATAPALSTALARHEQSVKWQIQRIYRARCDIVHSAGRVDQAALLCANLESYLKTLLDTFLQSLHSLQTMRTPKEFFDRRRHMYDRIMEQMRKNDQSLLIEMLGAAAS